METNPLHQKVLHLLNHLSNEEKRQELNHLINTNENLITDSITEEFDKFTETKNLLGFVVDYTIAQIRRQQKEVFNIGFDLIKKLVQAGADVNYSCYENTSRTSGHTSILFLADRSEELFYYLLENGARLNQRELDLFSSKNNPSNKMKFYHHYVEKDQLENEIKLDNMSKTTSKIKL
jgi:hypothetical protein